MYRFFAERGFHSDIKSNNEIDVLCPFPHGDSAVPYYETRPSAHINIQKGVYHCKTCAAEGRFNNGGLSEVEFFARIYRVTYEQAVRLMHNITKQANDDMSTWLTAMQNLQANGELITYLAQRGIAAQTAWQYQLGYLGEGIVYPVFVHGQLMDKRTYNKDYKKGEGSAHDAKIKSQRKAIPLLFPFDHWRHDTSPYTLLSAGESDTLLARQCGFNALTSTMGEGSFPKLFAGLFKDKDVYICYDCDDAGRTASRAVAFVLHEAGANVRIVDLARAGLQGTKDDKDIGDFFMKHGYQPTDLWNLMQSSPTFSPEDYHVMKNEHYPLVNLWDVSQGRNSGKRLSTRVIAAGKYDIPMEVPSAVEWRCNNPSDKENSPCASCPLKGRTGWWTLEEDKLDQVLELVEVTDQQQRNALLEYIGVPPKCPGIMTVKRAKQRVQKVIFTPDVQSETALDGYKSVEQYAYVVGDDIDLDDGFRYRVYFRRYPHPLDKQRIWMVVDRSEESDNAVNAFKMTPEIMEQLRVFQGDPFEVMKTRSLRAKDIVGTFAQEMVVHATDLTYHAPLQFMYHGKLERGRLEGLVVGESRTGKSKVAELLQKYYGCGNFYECKTATVAGLLGGADKLPSGGHKISWGVVPLNHKGLVVMDELSGMPRQVLSQLTAMRSSGIASVAKIVKGRAPAMTRLLWISNPRVLPNGQSMHIHDYPTGVHAVLDLVGADEDVARFDFIMMIVKPDTGYSSPMEQIEYKAYDSQVYQNLVFWVWSRKTEQIVWEHGTEAYVWQVSQELNERYDTDIKFFGAEAHVKLARIAVACAGATFSCDESGEKIVVTKRHVDWAANFMVRCYDNDVFRLSDFVAQRRVYTFTNDYINNIVAGMIRSHTLLMTSLAQQTGLHLGQLLSVSGLEKQQFDVIVSELARNYLIEVTQNGVKPTRRFRKAVEAYRRNREKTEMVPIQQRGEIGT